MNLHPSVRRVVLASFACCVLLLLPGCPPKGFYGRHIIVNNTGESVENLALAVGSRSQVLPKANPGQVWWVPKGDLGSSTIFTVSWKDKSGTFNQVVIDIAKEAGYHCSQNVVIDILKGGAAQWRLVPPS